MTPESFSQFKTLKPVQIERHRTTEHATTEIGWLCPVNGMFEITDTDIDRIVTICNQPPVYDFLFREKLEGEPYPREKAVDFLDWAQKGWLEKTHFVFLVRDANKQITAAVDIKSADLSGAEIGYWADTETPGYMTNAVMALVDLAKQAGYQRLFALIRPQNIKSVGVITRAGFAQTENTTKNEVEYLQYELALA